MSTHLTPIPQAMIDKISRYGCARTDGVNELDRMQLWDALFEEIKNYARSQAALKRVPLSPEQISNRLWEANWPESMLSDFVRQKLVELIRSVERAHGIGS